MSELLPSINSLGTPPATTKNSKQIQNLNAEILNETVSFIEALEYAMCINQANVNGTAAPYPAQALFSTSDFLMNMLSQNKLNIQSVQSNTDVSNTQSEPGQITPNIQAAVSSASEKYGVPVSLIQSVIKHESGMNASAVSSAGAIGLMQLMPGTGEQFGATNLYNPIQNIDAGTHYLANLIGRYHGNIPLALAAYNAGPGAVDKYGGIPPYKETQDYVSRIMHDALL